jgi:hypothetical protein
MSEADKVKATIQRELDTLRATRDELRLQLHLAAADARDEFNKLEGKLVSLEGELGRLGEQTKQPLSELSHAARDLTDEIKKGFARVRDLLKK